MLLEYHEKNNSSDVWSVVEYSFVTPQTIGGERVQYYIECRCKKEQLNLDTSKFNMLNSGKLIDIFRFFRFSVYGR